MSNKHRPHDVPPPQAREVPAPPPQASAQPAPKQFFPCGCAMDAQAAPWVQWSLVNTFGGKPVKRATCLLHNVYWDVKLKKIGNA